MILYFLKVIMISAVLILWYHALLEMEKEHSFKRVYLLISIAMSFIIPCLPMSLFRSAQPDVLVMVDWSDYCESDGNFLNSLPATEVFPVAKLLILGYVFIVFIKMFQFAKNLCIQRFIYLKNEVRILDGTKIVLLNEGIIPYSFMNAVYVNRDRMLNNEIREEVFYHEFEHVNQKHTLDLIFIELVRVVFWINPFWSLYKKAIRLNHEFLVDAAVVNVFKNVESYKKLIFETVKQPSQAFISYLLNFQTIKKRMIMLNNKNNTSKYIQGKYVVTLTVYLVLILMGGKISNSQPPAIVKDYFNKINDPGEIPEELFNEFQSLTKDAISYMRMKNGKMSRKEDYSNLDLIKLRKIYYAMSLEQKNKANQLELIINIPTLPSKKPPTSEQLLEWRDSKKFGIWLDGNRVDNSVLATYSTNDFALLVNSKLAKNAFNYGKHYFQINLITHTYFEKNYVQSNLYR